MPDMMMEMMAWDLVPQAALLGRWPGRTVSIGVDFSQMRLNSAWKATLISA